MRLITIASFVALLVASIPVTAQKVTTVDPKDVQLSPYKYKELPPALLKRIKATTDTFEKIDGMSYEQAVDLYKRDLDPESNLVLWEEMVRAYKIFCQKRCATKPEQADVYRSLLLRTMFSEDESIKRSKLAALSIDEARSAMKFYRLAPKPIDVIQVK
nr:hypothetical protein [uncultured Rhodoferax sp.]